MEEMDSSQSHPVLSEDIGDTVRPGWTPTAVVETDVAWTPRGPVYTQTVDFYWDDDADTTERQPSPREEH